MRLLLFSLLVCSLAFTGCAKKSPEEEPQPNEDKPQLFIPTKPNPKLETIRLWIGREEMTAEVAKTPLEIQTGMMFRTNVGENEGMLFPFASPRQVGFWMKNVDIPLSAAYIDPSGVILEIHDFEPQNTNTVLSASDRIQYVLETSRDWFKRHNIGTNTVVSTDLGPLNRVVTFRNSGM